MSEQKIDFVQSCAPVGELGNTEKSNSPAHKKINRQSFYWFFTFNNYTPEQLCIFDQILKPECSWFVFQEEEGSNGTKHLQGCIKLIQRKRLSTMKKLCSKIHWEETKDVINAIEYCTKLDTRKGQIYTHGINIKINIRKPIIINEIKGWQKKAYDIIYEDVKETRNVYWFWSSSGNLGKTDFQRWIINKHGEKAIFCNGKASNMYYAVANALKNNDIDIIVVNLPKSSKGYISYSGLESIKDGLIFSGKFKSGHVLFNSPKVVVFANCQPDYNKMSLDRWHVYEIIDNDNLTKTDIDTEIEDFAFDDEIL